MGLEHDAVARFAHTRGQETTAEGTVANIGPDFFNTGALYDWGILNYLYDDNGEGQPFEVLNYWVD